MESPTPRPAPARTTARFGLMALPLVGLALVHHDVSTNPGAAASQGPLAADTQVVTVYFAGTLLDDRSVFHFGGDSPTGSQATPELLQFLYHQQDDSDPNHHKIWVDGIGSGNVLDPMLAGRHANLCRPAGQMEEDPWDPHDARTALQSYGGGFTAGFECWDFRLREAVDANERTSLWDVFDEHREGPVVLNILGHSRGGILAMMLAHEVTRLQRRYHPEGDLEPVGERIARINILNFDAVPGNINEIGLHEGQGFEFHRNHEFFRLGPKVAHYVAFYAKDERQNIFEAVIPQNTEATKVWHLPLNGAHQTLVGNPRMDGHDYDPISSQDIRHWITLGSISKGHSAHDPAAAAVGVVTSIVARELLATAAWGDVRFRTSWRGNDEQAGPFGAADCLEDEARCADYFIGHYAEQTRMPERTRSMMRAVTHPLYLPVVLGEGGLQAWSFEQDACSFRMLGFAHRAKTGAEFGKCTYRMTASGLEHVSLIDRSLDQSGSGIQEQDGAQVCERLVALTGLPWRCDRPAAPILRIR